MKKTWSFALGFAAISVFLMLSAVATIFWMIISVIVNGGHPWPYDRLWIFGYIPFGFFILSVATALFLFRKNSFVKGVLKQFMFYLGAFLGAGTFAGTVFLLKNFAAQILQ